MKYLHVELPSLHLLWKRKGLDDMVCSAIRTNYPKPSPLIVAAIAREAGLEVDAIDMKIREQDTIQQYKTFDYGNGVMIASRSGMDFEALEDKLKNSDILGLSINPTSWAQISLDFIEYAKRVNPRLIVIVGGTDAMFRDKFYLSTGLIDFVVRGEGEYSGKELLERLSAGKKDFEQIPGISFVFRGKIKRNPKGRAVNLDDVPLPAFDLFQRDIPLWTTPIEYWALPEGATAPIGIIEFSRGCLEACGYCTTPQKYGRFRVKSIERIKKELEHFKHYGINTLNIWDDNIGSLIKHGKEEYLIAIINKIKETGFAFEFSQGDIPISYLWDAKKNEPNFNLIQALFSGELRSGKFVGCYGLYYPFEYLQGNEPSAMYSKLLPYEKELEILKALLDAGVCRITYSTILGTKEDDLKGIKRAVKRLKEVTKIIESRGAQGLATPFIFQPFSGAKSWNDYISDIVYLIEEYPELYQLNAAAHRTPFFEPHELTALKKDMEREMYAPKQYKRWISTGRYVWN